MSNDLREPTVREPIQPTPELESSMDLERLTEPIDEEQPPRLPFAVVGIGASAGALEAFFEFFRAMPTDAGVATVIVQHLPPDRESLLVGLLASRTTMPVLEVEDGMPIEADHVYVIRPGCTLTIRDGALHLGLPLSQRGHGRPVDDFFKSLAREQRERAIAIVMSGMGSNGTAGAQAIKAVGGLCIAQDLDSAQFPSMPRSLIEQGYADFILRPSEMPETLLRYTRHPYASRERGGADASERERHHINEIVALLRARTKRDFSGYKRPTLVRRIERRMGVTQAPTMTSYAQALRQNSAEAESLADDLLIHVTGFFRDPEAWEVLRQRVIGPLVAEREAGGAIRCWVTACSSGEEAYSLAMLLAEEAEIAGKRFDIKVFATDMAHRALSHARAGRYPNGIETDLTPERLDRFFTKDDDFYRVKDELRDLVVFAPQNLLQDPPFSRLDILSCRNLLIYLDAPTQARLLGLLHFGLRDRGVLFLGTSETTAGAEELFEPLDKRWRIFHRVGPTRHGVVEFPSVRSSLLDRHERPLVRVGLRASIAQLTTRALLDRFTPASVTVDRDQRVVFFHGDTDRYLAQPQGEPTRELLLLAREQVRGAVRNALEEVLARGEPVTIRDGWVDTPDGEGRVWVTAAPLEPKMATGFFLVSFEEHPETHAVAVVEDAPGLDSTRLRDELQRARDELQRTVHDLQGSNEDLRAANEEVTSINEELQSTNEELETSKEELQSLNEELVTVNAQLQAKIHEHEATSSDLSSLLLSTDIAVVFLDTKFRIRRYTPAVRDLLDLIPADAGRPLANLARKFVDPTLLRDAEAVLERLVPIEREVPSDSGRWYMRRVLPYRTADSRIDGVVITFVDTTRRKHAEDALRDREEQFRLLVEGARDFAMLLLDVEGRITAWNGGAERLLGYRESEALGQSFALIFTPDDREAGAPGAELERVKRDGAVEAELWQVRKDGSRFFASGVTRALSAPDGALRGYVKVLRDDSLRRAAADSLEQAAEQANASNRLKDEFLATVSHELRTPLSALLLWAKVLHDKADDPPIRARAIDAIVKSVHAQNQLIDDLLDTSRIAAGKLRIDVKDIELGPLVSTWVEAVLPTAEAKGVKVEAHLPPGLGTISTDPARLQQVVWNLLSNAVKFTPEGGRVDVTVRRRTNGVELRVTDSGKGIEPSLLSYLFEPFRQLDASVTRAHGGLGLGLSIARKLVELLGGTILADSRGLGEGSTFTVRLPLSAPAARGVAKMPSAAAGPADLSGVDVLLVEDTASTREALEMVLRGAGARVRAVDTASAALEAFREARPAVLVSDIAMPDDDGYSLMRAIRAREAEQRDGGRVPAIALTALARDEDRVQALSAGFDRYVSKPVDPESFLSEVAELIASRA